MSANWLLSEGQPQAYFYHYDGLGSVVALSDAAGNTAETYAYSVYGRFVVLAGGGTGNPYLFAGRRFDSETGLYYYRARVYSPELGRFLQTDPIGYADGINWYLYCGNNPIIPVDPWGLCGYNGGTRYEALVKPYLEYKAFAQAHPWFPAGDKFKPSGYDLRKAVFQDAGYSSGAAGFWADFLGGLGPVGRMAEGLQGVRVTELRATEGYDRFADVATGAIDTGIIVYAAHGAGKALEGTPGTSQPIDAPVNGKYPSWTTVRSRYWMKHRGQPIPPKHKMYGVSKELHHIRGTKIPKPHAESNLQEVWPWEHAEIDPRRYYAGPGPGN